MLLVFLIHLLEFLCAQAPKGSVNAQMIEFIYPMGRVAGLFFLVIVGCVVYRSVLDKPTIYLAFVRVV